MEKSTACVILLISSLVMSVYCRTIDDNLINSQLITDLNTKQNVESGRQTAETSTPNFVRLVVMRLIYGLASTMGLEERIEGAFNGAFVPPNADDGFFGFGGGSDDDDDDGEGLADIADVGGLGDILGDDDY